MWRKLNIKNKFNRVRFHFWHFSEQLLEKKKVLFTCSFLQLDWVLKAQFRALSTSFLLLLFIFQYKINSAFFFGFCNPTLQSQNDKPYKIQIYSHFSSFCLSNSAWRRCTLYVRWNSVSEIIRGTQFPHCSASGHCQSWIWLIF